MKFSVSAFEILLIVLIACLHVQGGTRVKIDVGIDINLTTAIAEVDERYLSVTLDSGIIRYRWQEWNFRSKRLRTLAAALSPCYLRLGGTDADFMVFNPQERVGNHLRLNRNDHMKVHDMQLDTCDGWKYCKPKNTTKFTMTREDWDNINMFSMDVGWRMLFDFNVLLSNGSDWSPTNARKLLQYTAHRNYATNIDFELGNEPNAFFHNFNRSITGQQLGRDFQVLKNIINEYSFSLSSLFGPDVTRPVHRHSKSVKFLKQFLQVAGHTVDAITWHQYYINGRTAVLENFTDPAILDALKTQIETVQKVVKHEKLSRKKVWLGETSSAWGGGAKGLSDSFVAGFMWLDKLGLSAAHGIDVVMRQSFVRGHYALLDQDLEPRPDYWLSLLYKQLVGTKVLRVSMKDKTGQFRLYAHCTASPKHSKQVPKYPPGAVTLYGMNLNDDADLSVLNFADDVVHQYLLTPHKHGKLKSHLVRLNGKTLKMVDDDTFPAMKPLVIKPGRDASIPPKTFGFFVIPYIRAQACL